MTLCKTLNNQLLWRGVAEVYSEVARTQTLVLPLVLNLQ